MIKKHVVHYDNGQFFKEIKPTHRYSKDNIEIRWTICQCGISLYPYDIIKRSTPDRSLVTCKKCLKSMFGVGIESEGTYFLCDDNLGNTDSKKIVFTRHEAFNNECLYVDIYDKNGKCLGEYVWDINGSYKLITLDDGGD